jgi:hypothetical protein
MPEALAFNLNFVHPLLMWSLLAGSAYALYLGIKAKKTRTGTPEQRKELIKGKIPVVFNNKKPTFIHEIYRDTGCKITYKSNSSFYIFHYADLRETNKIIEIYW